MKLNFGKQRTRKFKDNDRFKILNLTSSRNPDKSRTSFLSIMTDNNGEIETEQEKNDKLLQTIITDYNIGKHLSLKDYCIENSDIDFNFLSSITNTNKRLNDYILVSPKEEGEKMKLIEKSIVDKYREENSHYEHSIQKFNKAIKDLKISFFKTTGEKNFIKQALDYQNKINSDNTKQLKNINNMIIESKYINKQLREKLTEKIIEKDSLLNAVYFVISKYDVDMGNEIKSLIEKYNSQYCKVFEKSEEQKYIESLFNKIKVLEKKIASKNNEIKELQRFLIFPIKHIKNRKDIKTTIVAINKIKQ